MKRNISVFLLLIALGTLAWGQRGYRFNHGAYDYEILSVEDSTARLMLPMACGYNGNNVTIPRTVECHGIPYTVTEIGTLALGGCLGFDSVVLPSSLRALRAGACYGGTFRKTFTLPDSIEVIEGQTFEKVDGISHLTLPAQLRKITSNALENNALKSISISESNPYFCVINNALYSKDTSVLYCRLSQLSDTTFTVPNKVRVIKERAFAYSKLQHIVLPESLEHIEDEAFFQSKLHAIELPASLKRIDGSIFSGCTLLDTITINPANTHFRMGSDGIAIYSYDGDTLVSWHRTPDSITFPSHLKAIGGMGGNTKLRSIIIPDGVTTLLMNAFGQSTITHFQLPNSLRHLGAAAFHVCSNSSQFITFSTIETLFSLGQYSFYHTDIESFDLPKSLKSLPRKSFAETGLLKLKWNNDVEAIGAQAFFGTRLGSVRITSPVRTVGDSAFWTYNPSSVLKVRFLYPVDTIGLHSFYSPNHTQLYLVNTIPPVMTGYSIFMNDRYDKATIHIPCGSLQAYLDDPLWGRYADCYVEDNCDDINEGEALQMALYPNPTNGSITIESSSQAIERLEVYDLKGRRMLTERPSDPLTPTLQLNNLPNGTYIVRIITAQGIRNEKVVLNR